MFPCFIFEVYNCAAENREIDGANFVMYQFVIIQLIGSLPRINGTLSIRISSPFPKNEIVEVKKMNRRPYTLN